MRRSPIIAALDHLQRLVERPISREDRAELLRLIRTTIERESDAVAFLRSQAERRVWPGVGEVRRWVKFAEPAPCERCEGTGWVLREIHYPDGSSRPAATRCLTCRAMRARRRATR